MKRIGKVDEFEKGSGEMVVSDGIEIAVFRTETEWYAIANRCPHKNAPLHRAGTPRIVENGSDTEGRGDVNPEVPSINCPLHNLEFDLESGCNEVTNRCLPTFDVSVRGEDVLIDL